MRILVPIIILGLLLAGCQSGSVIPPAPTGALTQALTTAAPKADNPQEPAPVATQAVTRTPQSRLPVTAQELRGVQLIFWHPWTGDLAKELDASVEDFNRSNIWGITVQAVGQGSDNALETSLASALQANSAPALIASPPEAIAQLQQTSSAFADLKQYYLDPQWGLDDQEIADFYPIFWQEASVGDASYSMPVMRSIPVLFYNLTWAKALGYDRPPVSLSDFRAQSCAAAKANRLSGIPDNYGTGGWIVDTSSPAVYSWLAAGGGIPNPLPLDVLPFNNASSLATFTYLRKLLDDSCVWLSRNPTPAAYFAQRQALMYSGTLADLPAQVKSQAAQKSTDDWLILPYPSDSSIRPVLTSGPSLGILKSSRAEQLAAWLFIRWMTSPRQQALFAASGYVLPVRKSALDQMTGFLNRNPQWSLALRWLDSARPMPSQAWWVLAQRVLEDAAWQVFQPFTTADKIPSILQQLDATVTELLTNK